MNIDARKARKKSLRKKILGTKERPRLNVYRSNKHIYAALIDDKEGKILISASEGEIKTGEKSNNKEKALLVGKKLAEKALKKGYKSVIFDRAGYLYHGRVKNLANAAREMGLEF